MIPPVHFRACFGDIEPSQGFSLATIPEHDVLHADGTPSDDNDELQEDIKRVRRDNDSTQVPPEWDLNSDDNEDLDYLFPPQQVNNERSVHHNSEEDDFYLEPMFECTPPVLRETCAECAEGTCLRTNGDKFRLDFLNDLNQSFSFGDVDNLGRPYLPFNQDMDCRSKHDPDTLHGQGSVSNMHHPTNYFINRNVSRDMPDYIYDLVERSIDKMKPLFLLCGNDKKVHFAMKRIIDGCTVHITMTKPPTVTNPFSARTVQIADMRVRCRDEHMDLRRVIRMLLQQWLKAQFDKEWEYLAQINGGFVPKLMYDIYPTYYPTWFERIYNPWIYIDYEDGGFLENNPLMFPIQGVYATRGKGKKVTFSDTVDIHTFEISDNAQLRKLNSRRIL